MCKITLRNKLTRLLFPCLAFDVNNRERLCGGEKDCNTKFTALKRTHTKIAVLVHKRVHSTEC